jgi:transcriptional regulator with XRE-family HTH domain
LASNLQQARETLGARLRELRRATGLNGKQFAARLGWYGASRISKLELGQQTPTEQDLVEWTIASGAPEALAELRIQLNSLETFYSAWKRQLYTGVHARQQSLVELEAETTTFRGFVAALIPGLLQTPEYARSSFEYDAALHRVPPEVDEAVRLRMQRQDALHARGKLFHIVLTEAALRYTLAPRDVTVAQLEKLLVASTLRSVKLGVIPFGALIKAGALHGFWIHDDRLVLVETFDAELRLTQPDEIALYGLVFDQMVEAAVYGQQARNVISHVARTLPPSPDSPSALPAGEDRPSSGNASNS